MNQRIEKIKQHLIKYKEAYIAGAVGVIVGGVTVYALMNEDGNTEFNDDSASIGPIGPIDCSQQKNCQNIILQRISIYGNVLGRPGKPVFDTETGKRFESEKLAARAIGVSPMTMSNHLTGKTDSVLGRTLRFAEDAEVTA